MKQKMEQQQKQIAEKQYEKQRVAFYLKNCNRFIEETGRAMGDDDIADYLEGILEQLQDDFEKNGKPIPEQWIARLNDYSNEFNRERLGRRIVELQKDMLKIEARLHFVRNEIQREAMLKRSHEQQDTINRLMRIMAKNRFDYDMNVYKESKQFLSEISGLKI